MAPKTEKLAAPTEDAASILAAYEAEAIPRLGRLADIAQTIRDALAAKFADSEGGRLMAVKAVAATVGHDLLRERSLLAIEIKAAEDRHVMSLDRWMAATQAEAAAAKAEDPELATEDGRTARLMRLARSQDLAGLGPQELAVECRRLAAEGEARDAEVYLNALRLGGRARLGLLNELAKEVDKVLDEQVPHRKAAEQYAYDCRVARYTAQLAMIEDGKLVRALSDVDPTRPDKAVAAIRARVAGKAS